MPVRLSCPSCNSLFALGVLPAERRAACPRCGDVFPIRSWEEASFEDVSRTASSIRSSTRRERARWSLQRTAAVAILMGLIGLGAGLGVYYSRNGTPSVAAPLSRDSSSTARRPAELTALGYLPSDASIVFVLQSSPVLAFAERTRQEPRDFLMRAGIPTQFLDALVRMGLSLEHVDHAAGASNVDGLRLSLVLVLRQPIEEELFLKHLRATRQNGSKDRHNTDVGGVPLTLARISSTVWVFGFDAKKDLDAVDKGGHGPGGKQFAPSLVEMIDRVPPDAAAWIATADDHWDGKPLVKMVIGEVLKKPEWLPVLARGRALAAALSLEDPPRLRLFVRTADASIGERLREYFHERAATADGATTGGAGELAFFDMPIDPSTTFTILREMLSEAVRP